MSETKKRLLLSKWHGHRKAGSDAKEEALAEMTWLRDDLESTLLDVKDWMLDVLVHHRPMSDPRVILRKIEDVLR